MGEVQTRRHILSLDHVTPRRLLLRLDPSSPSTRNYKETTSNVHAELVVFLLCPLLPPACSVPTTQTPLYPKHGSQFQRGLILGHVELLEPRWKDNPAPMRIFTAPLNSEVAVARNIHDLVRVLGPGKGKDVKVGATVGVMKPRPSLGAG